MQRKNSDRQPVRKSETGKDGGFYSGTYQKDGSTLTRQGDGLILKICQRPPLAQTRFKSPSFLVDHTTEVGGKYVSSLWGSEFEYGRVRYRITTQDGGSVVIAKKRRRRRRINE